MRWNAYRYCSRASLIQIGSMVHVWGAVAPVAVPVDNLLASEATVENANDNTSHYYNLLTLLELPLIEVGNAMRAYCYSTASYP